ncbi:hypothetical protein [Nocardioides sp. LHG3406-4]|uniref:hypothetical protein n=1 Tax=Nocardioides sp. LHG3406-4 TaxID=2804575 RepID=UPI003CEFAE3A
MTLLAGEMRAERAENAQTYLRRDVFEARDKATLQRLEDVERDNADKEKAAELFRRQIIVGLILAAVPAVLAMVLAVNNFIASGGQTP